jgi:Fic family protein
MLKKLPLPNDFETPEILELSLKANDALATLDKLILTIDHYDLLLQPLTIREAVASNDIENIRTTTLEMLQAEILNPQILPSAQKEVLHYKKSLLLGLQILNETKQFLLEDLINIHCGIVPEKVGIRNRPGVVIGNRLGEVIYTPPQDPREIKDYITNLFEYIYSPEVNSLVKIIITHYQFEAIHPFFDGNGRVGRILMALQFCLENKLRYPILYTSGYIFKNKATYYELFREIQQTGNWHNWIIFHLNGIINQATETALRVHEIKNLQATFTSQIPLILKLPQKVRSSFEQYFFTKAFYTQTDMIKTLGVSRNSAKKYLLALFDKGMIDSRKAGRETLYFIPEFVSILS